MKLALFTDGFSKPILGKSFGVYRHNILKNIDNKTIENVSSQAAKFTFKIKLKFFSLYILLTYPRVTASLESCMMFL